MINENLCPFCKKENGCQAHISNNNCWCNKLEVPSELRKLVPSNLQMKACICRNCVLLFQNDKEEFIKKYNK